MSLPSFAFYMHDLSGGGVERMRLSLIAELRRLGHPVVLIVHQKSGPLVDLVDTDLKVAELRGRGTLGNLPHLIRLLRQERPALLFSSLHHNNIAAMLAGAAAGVPVVVCQHNALSRESNAGAPWHYRLVPALYRALSAQAAAFIAVSEGVAEDFAARTGISRSRVAVIPNPVHDQRFCSLMTPPPPHPWLADRTLRCFLSAGRLVAQKDPETLLLAFAQLADPQARLLLLGDGELEPRLRALTRTLGIEAHVHFAGFVADPLAWMAHAAAFVLSSRHEGFGNVLVEALACGTPVISTDCPHGPREILEDGRYGRLVPVGDIAALATALAENPPNHFSPGSCRARAAEFSASRCAAAHSALAERILSERSAGPRVFGLRLSRRDATGIADDVLRIPPKGTGPSLVVTPNIDHVRLLREARFRAAYTGAAIVCPDGFPIALYGWLVGGAAPHRITGCDIVHALFTHELLASHRVFAVVECSTTEAALRGWAHRHLPPGALAVATAPAGLLLNDEASGALAGSITAHRTTVLLVTLGAPTSEIFVSEACQQLPACWALCVGQAVRVELGLCSRGPAALRPIGLEWVWRLVSEPRRLWRRYLAAAVWYPVAVVRDRLRSA